MKHTQVGWTFWLSAGLRLAHRCCTAQKVGPSALVRTVLLAGWASF